MTIVFPKNNLPEPSQPWAREVQKQLVNVIASDSANEINNAARDNQLNSSLITLTAVANSAAAAAAEAQEAINGLLGLGDPDSGYTLNVNNITSGGVRDGVLTLSSGSNSSIELFNGGVNINGPGAEVQVGSNGGLGTNIEGNITVNGGNLDINGSTGTVRTNGSFIRLALAGGGTTGASINDNGSLVRTTSSERYKQDIEDLDIQYEDLLSLQARRFRLKDEVTENFDARYYAGFIAEELNETSLKDFVSYEKLGDGTKRPDGVYYGELTAALLEAIKHQDQLIKSLTNRIEILEGKVE
jgi:hypothetical protein